jgi:hypothetical protein
MSGPTRRFPSVREILVVQSTRIGAEILRWQSDDHWPKGPEQIGPGRTIRLDSIGLACAIEEVYADTDLG